jgi:CHAD domain-containing protein
VHEARKHLKKVRALIRLLRPATGEAFYKDENAAMRQAAGRMSSIRDSHVRVQTIEKLTAKSGKRRTPAAFARIRTAMADQKQIRVGLQIKLALLSLVQDYRRLQEVAASVVDVANRSPELSKFVSDQLNMFVISSPRTALRVIAGSTMQSLNAGNPLPHPVDEGQKR